MSLARGIYGIEYNPGRRDEHPLGPFGWLVILVLLAAAVSLVVTLCRRKSPQAEDMTVLVVLRDGKAALRRRPDTGLLAGLWEFPNVPGKLEPGQALETAAA